MRYLTLLPLLLSSPAWAGYSVTGTPKVGFQATGSVMDMEGVGHSVTLADDGTNLAFTVPMATVTTDNSLRDEHMHDNYVEVAKFPNAVISFPRAAVKLPAGDGEKVSGSVGGTFMVHGVNQPVSITYTAKRAKGVTKVDAKFAFDVSKHGISIPSYLGVTIEPAMTATVALELAGA